MFVGVCVVNQVLVRGGCNGILYLRHSIIDSDFAGLNDTSHLTSQACILARSAFSSSAALIGLNQ